MISICFISKHLSDCIEYFQKDFERGWYKLITTYVKLYMIVINHFSVNLLWIYELNISLGLPFTFSTFGNKCGYSFALYSFTWRKQQDQLLKACVFKKKKIYQRTFYKFLNFMYPDSDASIFLELIRLENSLILDGSGAER